MTRSLLTAFFSSTLLLACAADVDVRQYAVDVDSSGNVDCSDLAQLESCIPRPHHEDCLEADVNEDGAVDHQDAHDIHEGLAEIGEDCAEPDPTADHEDMDNEHGDSVHGDDNGHGGA